jgi:hypothetical protein
MDNASTPSTSNSAAETADALAALLRRKAIPKEIAPPPRDASNSLTAQDPRAAIVTIAVRAALYALQSMQNKGVQKRTLARWNTPLVLEAGDMLDTGTRPWFDRTFIQVKNTGQIPATAQVADQYIQLEPGQQHTVDGAWAAFIVRVRNLSDDPRAEFTVTIT